MSDTIGSLLSSVAYAHAQSVQPLATFEAIDKAAAAIIGHKLFTMLVYDHDASEVQRIYTSMPEVYPVAGRKSIASNDSLWIAQVLQRGEAYIGRDAEDLRTVFFDHELIVSLGCRSVLNVPVRWRSETVGTLNLLHEEGWYRPEHIELGRVLAQLALPALTAR